MIYTIVFRYHISILNIYIMSKKKYNFNNIKEMSDKKIHNPQERKIQIEKRNWARNNPKYV